MERAGMRKEHQFKIVDEETGNTVALYDTRALAEARLRYLAEAYPARAEFLILVSLAKDGQPLQAQGADELLQSA